MSAQVDEDREHTERVRLQVIAASHTADARHSQSLRKQDALAAKVDVLSDMVTNLLKTGGGVSAPRAAWSLESRVSAGPKRDAGDSLILRAHTHKTVERENMLEAVRGGALRVAGASAGRKFVIKVQGEMATATSRVDALVHVRRDEMGQRRTVDVWSTDGGSTRVYLGRDKPRSQLQAKMVGKRLVAILKHRMPTSDIYHRHRDGVVLADRQALAKLQLAESGSSKVLWNTTLLGTLGISKSEVLKELDRSVRGGSGEAEWES